MKTTSSPSGGGCRSTGNLPDTPTPATGPKPAVTAADLAKNAYKEQYGVIVICVDEAQQIGVYEALKSQFPNNKIRVVTT